MDSARRKTYQDHDNMVTLTQQYMKHFERTSLPYSMARYELVLDWLVCPDRSAQKVLHVTDQCLRSGVLVLTSSITWSFHNTH